MQVKDTFIIDKIEAELVKILTPDVKDRCHIIYILQQVQEKLGYVPKEAMRAIARFLEIPGSTVYGIVTFYNQFRLNPLGNHPVKVCMGTACHLAGGKLVLEAMARELDIEVGGTTSDREFSLDRVACVGCCALAPVVMIDQTIYSRVTPPKVEEILVSIKPAVKEHHECE